MVEQFASGRRFIHWLQNDLRLHDMPAINAALQKCTIFYPVYIFEEDDLKEKKTGYNRIRFILESLKDINEKLRQHGGRIRQHATHILELIQINVCQPHWPPPANFGKESREIKIDRKRFCISALH